MGITTSIRPDYHEWFPHFSPAELIRRRKRANFALATLLVPGNILRLAQVQPGDVAADLRTFVNLPFARQRAEVVKVLEYVGCQPDAVRAIGTVPRELFVPGSARQYSYLNTYLPWSKNSCLSSPAIVAMMLGRLLPVEGNVVEIGVGSGYHAACLVEACPSARRGFIGLERNAHFYAFGRKALDGAGYHDLKTYEVGNGFGNAYSPSVDAIYCTAAGTLPSDSELLRRLRPGGLLQVVEPLNRHEFDGEPSTSWLRSTFGSYEEYQGSDWRKFASLRTYQKQDGNFIQIDVLYDVSFVPLQLEEYVDEDRPQHQWMKDLAKLQES